MKLLKFIPLLWLCVRMAAQPLAPAALDRIAFTFSNGTEGPARATPAFVTIIGRNAAGRFCHLTREGRFPPCAPEDRSAGGDGRPGYRYGLPLAEVQGLTVDRALRVDGGRIYLSVGEPVWLGLDEATGGLVEPDPANPADPNAALCYDWVEFALDPAGFHGNTTCVDQFGLPVTLAVVDRTRGRTLGPVGLAGSRTALLRAWAAEAPEPFRQLEDGAGRRILAPSHAPALVGGDYFAPLIQAFWARYRTEPLILTPVEGTFTGRVEPDGRLVFTQAGAPGTWVIAGPPSTAEVFRCDGVLARGRGLERVLGAQLAAILNRHVQDPLRWRSAEAYYQASPCNHYARFWHAHSLDGRAYGFPYDDVNEQSSFLAAGDPAEIRIAFRWD